MVFVAWHNRVVRGTFVGFEGVWLWKKDGVALV